MAKQSNTADPAVSLEMQLLDISTALVKSSATAVKEAEKSAALSQKALDSVNHSRGKGTVAIKKASVAKLSKKVTQAKAAVKGAKASDKRAATVAAAVKGLKAKPKAKAAAKAAPKKRGRPAKAKAAPKAKAKAAPKAKAGAKKRGRPPKAA